MEAQNGKLTLESSDDMSTVRIAKANSDGIPLEEVPKYEPGYEFDPSESRDLAQALFWVASKGMSPQSEEANRMLSEVTLALLHQTDSPFAGIITAQSIN